MLLPWKIRFVLSGAVASMAWRKKRIVSPQGWCGDHLPYGVQRKALLPQESSSRSCSQGGRRGNFHSWMKQMSLPNGGAAQGAAPMESSARRCSHGSPAQGAAPKEEEEEASYPHGQSREATSQWGSSARRCPYWSPAQGAAPEEEEEDLSPIMAKAPSTSWWN